MTKIYQNSTEVHKMCTVDVENSQIKQGVHKCLAKNTRFYIFSVPIVFCAHWNHNFIAILVKCNVCVGS